MQITFVGECALLVRLADQISQAAHRRVMRLFAALDAMPPQGVVDLVPAYASLLIRFDPLVTCGEALEERVRALARTKLDVAKRRRRLVRIPVAYGGADGPDLEDVARQLGLSAEAVVQQHTEREYHVYFLGFMAGFPYMGDLPDALAVPRLAVPRPRVPAGSVAIVGRQTGIYPRDLPGGWRIIGRTALHLFDPTHEPPALLRPGDRVRFEAASERVVWTDAADGIAAQSSTDGGIPWVRVEEPGWLSTVQDLGRPGYGRYGVSPSGAADVDALRLGNALVDNPPGAAALEVTLGGVRLEVLAASAVAITGAECEARSGRRVVRHGSVIRLTPGERLDIGTPRTGMRTYVCVAGGVATPLVLGSRSTDVRVGIGGLDGRPLRRGDVLTRGGGPVDAARMAGRRLPEGSDRSMSAAAGWSLRVLAMSQVQDTADTLAALVSSQFTVDPRSDRVGVRLRRTEDAGGATIPGGEMLTEGVVRGAIQVPPGGEPILLLADHQTTGGYRVPAVVIAADQWKLGQLRPGDTVRFALCTPDEAVAELRVHAAWLDGLPLAVTNAVSRADGDSDRLDAAALMRGFAEWSEEAGSDT